MKFLDIKDFRKVHQDDHTATLSSPKGHSITVLIKKLSPLQQEQLKSLKLYGGGEVKGVHRPADDKSGKGESIAGSAARESKKDRPEHQEQHRKTAIEEHKQVLAESQAMPAPKLQNLDQGGSVQYDSSGYPIKSGSAPLPPPAPPDQAKASGFASVFHADGGPIEARHMYADQKAPVAADDAAPQTDNPVANMAATPVDTSMAAQPQGNVPLENPNGTVNAPAALNLGQTAAREQQGVEATKGANTAVAEDAYMKQRAELAQRDQNLYKELKGHADDFAHYIQAHPINPNAYKENMDTGDKLGVALGMFAGGLKQGLIGGNNPAMDFFNQQIERDIKGQVQRNEQQQTIYGAYKHLYGEGIATNALTKVSTNDVYVHKLQQIAAKLGTPQAKAAADAFAAQKALENQQLLQNATQDRAIQSSYNNQGPAAPAAAVPANPGATGAWGNQKESNEDKILKPDAEQHFKNLAYTPKAKDQYGEISRQYNGAVQAEKSLKQLDSTFEELEKNTNGLLGRLHRGAGESLSRVPGDNIFSGAVRTAGGLASGITNTNTNRAYDAAKSKLVGAVSAALKGTNIGSGQIQEIVDANAPEAGDSPELKMQKRKNIKEFIKNHTDTSLLSAWGLQK